LTLKDIFAALKLAPAQPHPDAVALAAGELDPGADIERCPFLSRGSR
jgi:hypothetical protein